MKPGTSRCHIGGLQPSTTYNVTVIAMEAGVKDVTWSQSFTTGVYNNVKADILKYLSFL